MNLVIEQEQQKDPGGWFSKKFYYAFRSMFIPVTRFLIKSNVSPNTVTCFSLALGVFTGFLFAVDWMWVSLPVGISMSLLDIIDGQLAKATGGVTKFGGILDSSIDRYNDFFLFVGFSFRYYFMERPLWILLCAVAFLGSVMISYIRARAESAGFACRVGKLQRPERLALIGIGVLIDCFGFHFGIDVVIVFLAFGTHVTAVNRLLHVYRQSTQK